MSIDHSNKSVFTPTFTALLSARLPFPLFLNLYNDSNIATSQSYP